MRRPQAVKWAAEREPNVGLDLYNVLNSSAVLNSNQTFIPNGSWLRPTLVLTSRFAKISATVDF
jgi:hypothetical protein